MNQSKMFLLSALALALSWDAPSYAAVKQDNTSATTAAGLSSAMT